MTIDEEITRLKEEIQSAENALKVKLTEFDYSQLVQNAGKVFLTSSSHGSLTNSVMSFLPPTWRKKYGNIFNAVQKAIKLLS